MISSRQQPAAATPHQKGAYVFVIYGEDCKGYFFGALLTCRSLILKCCEQPRVLLYTRDVPSSYIDLARETRLFTELLPTEYIEAPAAYFSNPEKHQRFRYICTKYRVFGLEQYKKVLLLDTDLHVRANLDDLFDLPTPAAMVRGPNKPPHGRPLPVGAPINAGVMLLQPDARFLHEVVGSLHRQLTSHVLDPAWRLPPRDSPDADLLTSHHHFRGRWISLGLQYNFQLEFERLDGNRSTVRFASRRQEHFDSYGANLDFQDLKVLHFSGAKLWDHLLKDCRQLTRLRAEETEGEHARPLADKLERGIREYAEMAAGCQGVCQQLNLGRDVLWCETKHDCATFSLSPEETRRQLEAHLPADGCWFAGKDATVHWLPPGQGKPLEGHPYGRVSPVGCFLEVGGTEARLRVGDAVRLKGEAGDYKLESVSEDGVAHVRRRLKLPTNWTEFTDEAGMPFYMDTTTGGVQYEFPGQLPKAWKLTYDGNEVYYYNRSTKSTSWYPPEFEDLEVPLESVKASPMSKGHYQGSEATVWKRSFNNDHGALVTMSRALATASGGVHDV